MFLFRGWTILAVIALLATLASGSEFARDGASHSCDGMKAAATVEDCHQMAEGAAAADCATVICVAAQTALPPHDGHAGTLVVWTLSPEPAPRDDARLRDLRSPPDLRPPIA